MNDIQPTLHDIDVAAPCPASWDKMSGDDRVRFCDLCELNVYNLSGMSRREAEELVLEAEGRVCVRFLRRGDGTVLTDDCPVGLRALRKKAVAAWARVAALVAFLFPSVIGCTRKADPKAIEFRGEPTIPSVEMLGDVAHPPLMGKPAIRPPVKK